jgi:hypothetical protein
MMFSTQTTSILFNWSLNDRAGAPIWVTTIAGDGKGTVVSLGSKGAAREQVEMVLSDVFQKSLREISASPLIREFAAHRRKSNP